MEGGGLVPRGKGCLGTDLRQELPAALRSAGALGRLCLDACKGGSGSHLTLRLRGQIHQLHTNAHTHTHVCTCTPMCTHTYACTRTHMHACTRIHTYMHVCTDAHTHAPCIWVPTSSAGRTAEVGLQKLPAAPPSPSDHWPCREQAGTLLGPPWGPLGHQPPACHPPTLVFTASLWVLPEVIKQQFLGATLIFIWL